MICNEEISSSESEKMRSTNHAKRADTLESMKLTAWTCWWKKKTWPEWATKCGYTFSAAEMMDLWSLRQHCLELIQGYVYRTCSNMLIAKNLWMSCETYGDGVSHSSIKLCQISTSGTILWEKPGISKSKAVHPQKIKICWEHLGASSIPIIAPWYVDGSRPIVGTMPRDDHPEKPRWGCPSIGVPPWLDGVFMGKSQRKLDDDWGYPHDLGNPQCFPPGFLLGFYPFLPRHFCSTTTS